MIASLIFKLYIIFSYNSITNYIPVAPTCWLNDFFFLLDGYKIDMYSIEIRLWICSLPLCQAKQQAMAPQESWAHGWWDDKLDTSKETEPLK